MSGERGRVCPLRYRYGPAAIEASALRDVETLYAIGGLYGNLAALDAVTEMIRIEEARPTLCFNGDFNWFDIADRNFVEINRRVLDHDAILGNVEAEFGSEADDAGCGCAYPEEVEAAVVERSNEIHRRLKETARRHPQLATRLARLPMFARYRVGRCRVAVVHGDAHALAGWRFDAVRLADKRASELLRPDFEAAEVDVFASTHTCLPALRRIALRGATEGWIANNGAAGMPNFAGDLSGLVVRIGCGPSPHEPVREVRIAGAFVALLPVRYDNARWRKEFLSQWPAGSPAHASYFDRISRGPAYSLERVAGGAHGHQSRSI